MIVYKSEINGMPVVITSEVASFEYDPIAETFIGSCSIWLGCPEHGGFNIFTQVSRTFIKADYACVPYFTDLIYREYLSEIASHRKID